VLFLASLVCAARARGRIVTLAEKSEVFPDGRLRIRMPSDWDRTQTQISSAPGIVAEAHRLSTGVSGSKHTGETLVVTRSFPRRYGIPSIEGVEALRQTLHMLGGSDAMVELPAEPARAGSFPSWTLYLAPDERAGAALHRLGVSALAPDGQIVSILLFIPRQPKPEDFRLIENMNADLELTGLQAADKPQQLMKDAGITFTLPAGARLFTTTNRDPLRESRVRMAGGQGRSTWYLDAVRVPLVGERQITHLVEEHALNLLEQFELPEPIHTRTLGGRSIAQINLTLPENRRPTVLLAGAEIDDQTGLLFVGRYETDGEEPLRSALEAVAAGHIDSLATTLDLAKAREVGRQHLKAIAADGLDTCWSDKSLESYLIHAPRISTRKEIRTYKSLPDREGAQWWEIQVSYLPATAGIRLTANIQERWVIRNDAASHGGTYRKLSDRDEESKYAERRLARQNEVKCESSAGNGNSASWVLPVDDTYGCEPVLIAASARVARDPQSQPAVFTASERHCPRPIYWLVVPLGQQPLPDAPAGQTAPAVRLTRDYDPMPIIIYYAEDDSVKAISFDEVLWQTRITEAANSRTPPPRQWRSR